MILRKLWYFVTVNFSDLSDDVCFSSNYQTMTLKKQLLNAVSNLEEHGSLKKSVITRKKRSGTEKVLSCINRKSRNYHGDIKQMLVY